MVLPPKSIAIDNINWSSHMSFQKKMRFDIFLGVWKLCAIWKGEIIVL